eukprot:Filipodium_phascolosomae@DN2193_c0_g1_i1.p1
MFSSDIGGFGTFGGGGGYDAGGGGAGYDSSQMPYGTPAGYDASQGGKGSRKRGFSAAKSVDGVMPCMVTQLTAANAAKATADDNLVINGRECSQVTIVGRIVDKDLQNMSVTFTVRDSTGEISVKKYLDGDDNRYTRLEAGHLVRVVGMLRHQGFIGAFGIREVQSEAELLFHETECAYVHLTFLQQDNGTSDGGGGGGLKPSASPAPSSLAGSQEHTTAPNNSGGAGSAANGGGGAFNAEQDGNELERFLLEKSTELGYTSEEMADNLGWSAARAANALRALEDEGLVYVTKPGRYNHVDA